MSETFKENEAVKLIRMKQSLLKISESYLELAHKCIHIFEAQREVALSLPDVQDANVENIKYTGIQKILQFFFVGLWHNFFSTLVCILGAVSGRHAVLKAKDKVERYRRNSISSDVHQPPPYNPHYPQQQAASNAHRRSNTCPEFLYPQLDRSAWGWNASQSISENSSHNQSANGFSPPALNDRHH